MKNKFLRFLVVLTPLFFCSSIMWATIIKGLITDAEKNEPLEGVIVVNVHTEHGMQTGNDGLFNVKVESGQLIEFRKMGYKTIRIRIPNGELPNFYKINMKIEVTELEGVIIQGNVSNHKKDSLQNAYVYQEALAHYKLEGFDIIQHPFDALNKRNRQIWAFQKHYEYWESQKFVDYVFNEKLIGQLTKLPKDSMSNYMRIYRPSYVLIKSFYNDYEFYEYIKETVAIFRNEQKKYIPNPQKEFRIDYDDR
jgi:hypothetical protein